MREGREGGVCPLSPATAREGPRLSPAPTTCGVRFFGTDSAISVRPGDVGTVAGIGDVGVGRFNCSTDGCERIVWHYKWEHSFYPYLYEGSHSFQSDLKCPKLSI